MDYWKYYDRNYDWSDTSRLMNPELDYTVLRLRENGIDEKNARRLFQSGYVCIEPFEVLIDRYYGGPIASYDSITRFSISEAHNLLSAPAKSSVIYKKVASLDELKSAISSINLKGDLVFRGQIKNHTIQREINNPYLTIPDLGEVSLLPSLWRKMIEVNPNSFKDFSSLSLLEWSNIFYKAFDMEEIEKRHKALIDAGEWVYTMSEMEDCSDPMLREFGKFRMDLSMGMNFNLHAVLTTLLQHYGLYSPVLDLTSSLDVALFFATHKFEKKERLSTYTFVGSNNKQSVLYVLGYNSREMKRHDERDEFLKYLEPQRPIKQKCVICPTNQYSINLPALYLRGVFLLDFEVTENISKLSPEDIFPNKDDDTFLKSLSGTLFKKEHITIFNNDDILTTFH